MMKNYILKLFYCKPHYSGNLGNLCSVTEKTVNLLSQYSNYGKDLAYYSI